MENPRWGLMVSFFGKNAQDVIEHYAGTCQLEKIGLLIYETENCGAYLTATKHGIPTIQLKPDQFPNQKEYQLEILKHLKSGRVNQIFLLGYQYLIRREVLEYYQNRIVNVHPSLFPSFLGTKTAIQDALNYGVKVSGVTTHIIDSEYDKGEILLQEAISFEENDTFESLYPKFSEVGLNLILNTMYKIETKFLERANCMSC